MKYTPRKIFILESGKYIELTYEEFCHRKEEIQRFFISLHGVLMEVSAITYQEYYKDKRRQKYITERAIAHGDFSYDALDTEEFHSEDILIDRQTNVAEEVEQRDAAETVRRILLLLSREEQEFVDELITKEKTER